MKRIYALTLLICLAGLMAFPGCKKDQTTNNTDPNADSACTGCENNQATAANDASQQGMYKGLLLTGDGLGHFKLNVKNTDDNITMWMKYTRSGYPVLMDTLKPNSTVTIDNSKDLIMTMLGKSRTSIDITKNGTYGSVGDWVLSGSISTGPKPQATMMKELSTAQVKVFEGTMQGGSATAPNGMVGFVVRGDQIEGIITGNGVRERFSKGTIGADKKFSFSFSGNNSVYSGQFTSDTEISGSWTIQGSPAGTFTAKRAF